MSLLSALPTPRRIFSASGPVGIVKVVNIAPVLGRRRIGRRRYRAGHFLEKGFDDAGFAGAGQTGDKNIEARFVDAEAELDRPNRAILADKVFQRRHLRRASKRQIGSNRSAK